MVQVAGLALALLLPSLAAAQAHARANLAVSYSHLREIGSYGATYGTGWIVSVASRPNQSLSYVGEIGGS